MVAQAVRATPAHGHDTVPSLEELRLHLTSIEPGTRAIPIYREILADLETPVSAYLKISKGLNLPGFMLESVEGGIRIARYSFIGVNPVSTLTLRDGRLSNQSADGSVESTYDDPLAALADVLANYRTSKHDLLPSLTGGAIGYLSYDAIRHFEPRVGLAPGTGLGFPDAQFQIAESLVVFDHLERVMKVVSHVAVGGSESLEAAYERAVARIDELTATLNGDIRSYPMRHGRSTQPVSDRFQPNTSFERYHDIVNKAKEYIHDGDIFQVVLSQRIDIATDAHPFTLYRALRMINPSPYMFFLDFGDHQIVGASPELLVRLEDGVVTNHPIAGTRPRGQTVREDDQHAIDLMADEKELAEHIMLVDLGRNDVGRVSKPGSVHVPKLMEIERFSHVMHIVSNVEGQIADGLDNMAALRSCFPAGTVSGAPKIRAMEIIAELESDRRGVYSGAVGYFDFAGGMDTCIALRTMVVKDGVASLQAGGGIVADSTPDGEYAESFHKMRALVRAIERAEQIEASAQSVAERTRL
ncbi:MAG: anthranilate synthase component I [Chloroflexia bacterium]|nr:anthranilate synthase component I [Chloroflexia bacterium]